MTSTSISARTVALAATLGLAAVAWVFTLREMSGMDMGIGTALGSFDSFLALWVVMMAAMMLPAAAPVVVRRAQSDPRATAVPLFVGS
jgi:predicted metal-binding membrane protein